MLVLPFQKCDGLSSRNPLLKRGDQSRKWYAKGFAEIVQLHQIETALAGFDITQERLRRAQGPAHLHLGQATPKAGFANQRRECGMFGAVKAFAHGRRPKTASTLYRVYRYLNSGYACEGSHVRVMQAGSVLRKAVAVWKLC
ncbi:MAG: hypothetical protein ACREPN_03575 [Rudaea sp.]